MKSSRTQNTTTLFSSDDLTSRTRASNNKLLLEDRSVHDWYLFVLSYPAHLVRTYLEKFNVSEDSLVLDPFCGTGTTVVECKKLGVPSVGLEANPVAHLASSTKVDWSVNPKRLTEAARKIAKVASAKADTGIRNGKNLRVLPESLAKLILKNSICANPLHRSLVLIDEIHKADRRFRNHLLVAMAKALVSDIGNLHFGPEVGVRGRKDDAPVVESWIREIEIIASDLEEWQSASDVPSCVHLADARTISDYIEPESVSTVITSPPYPNEKDYTRTTRLEGVLLGYIRDKEHLRSLKKTLVRSNTRGVYVADDDDKWISDIPDVGHIAQEIEARRIELGKTSGFERQYHRVTKLYFGGMARHLSDLRSILRPGARLAYVVGDQASYLRVMIRTGKILAQIAEKLGYEVEGIDLFRTRRATATRAELREEVLVLRWPGKDS